MLNLETIALARVAQGQERLETGRARTRRGGASGARSRSTPNLPDAHLGLALTEGKKGPLGLVPASATRCAGVLARLDHPARRPVHL